MIIKGFIIIVKRKKRLKRKLLIFRGPGWFCCSNCKIKTERCQDKMSASGFFPYFFYLVRRAFTSHIRGFLQVIAPSFYIAHPY